MTLSDFSIRNPVFAWMLMIGLIVFGWISFQRLGVSQLPDVDFPVVSVDVAWEGAAPQIMETQVTDAIEDAVMSVEGIKEVTSSSKQGSASITIEFDLNRNIDAALQEVQTKIAQAQRNLPTDIDTPVVTKSNPEDQPIMWLALSGDRSLKDLTHYVSEILKDQITTVSGVGNVRLGGFIDPNLRVWLDAKKMQEKEMTVEDVLNAINSQHADRPAGYLASGPKEINVRVYGEAGTPEEFQKIIIPSRVRGGAVWKQLTLADIGTVEDGLADIRRISRSMGRPAIGLGIVKQRGTNAVAVASAVKARAKELQKGLPEGMRLDLVFDTTGFIEESVHELNFNLILSAILTSLVCYFFLGTFSATFNVLLAIPTSIIGTFIVMHFLGFTVNTFTMLGLSLVIGIVVDDAIMVLENISRYREHGHSKMQAAFVGAREITFPALAASVAILAIFIPVIFMEGVLGKFFFQFGVTISVAVMLSLVEALTIAPMRCSQFLEVGHTTQMGHWVDKQMGKMTQAYQRQLRRVLESRIMKVIFWVLDQLDAFFGQRTAASKSSFWRFNFKFAHFLSVLVFMGLLLAALTVPNLFLTKPLRKEFVPSQDQSRFLVRITLPLGSSMEMTNDVFKKAEALLMKRPELNNYYAAVGGFGGGQVNSGNLFITMKPKKERPKINGRHVSMKDFMQTVRKEFGTLPGIDRVTIQDLSLSGFSAKRGFPVEFTVMGPDWDTLGSLSGQIAKKMQDSGLMTDVDTDYELGMPELQVYPDRQKAAEHGVSISSIANTINAMIGGVRNGKFTSRGKRYDVRVRLVDTDRTSPKDVQKIWVRNQYGEVVPLSQVTTAEVKPSLFSITRKNRQRAINVFANPAAGHSQQEALDAVHRITREILPQDYRVAFSGGAQAFKESSSGMIFALVMGLFVAYMVLATQFNSFIHPFTVLLALPFSLTGAFIALLISNNSINLYSMIGVILLMGIVKKNSILLVDFTNERRRHGLDVKKALLEACPVRLRPIIMTSISTVAAAIPPALAMGAGAETMVPMAVTIVGGVTVSTILTLFVVPCAYEIFSRFEKQSYLPAGSEPEEITPKS